MNTQAAPTPYPISSVARTPDEAFAGLPRWPYEPRYVDVQPGLRMHYIDEGPAGADPILLFHGMPAWSYLYRTMIPTLVAAGHRVVAPDQIGFGRSDKPMSEADYTLERHVAWFESFVTALGLSRITMVCHDFGGMLGLRVAARSVPRVARFVIFNTSLPTADDEWPEPYLAAFNKWKEYLATAPVLVPSLAIRTQVARAAEIPEAEFAAYDAPFPDPSFYAGLRVNETLYPLADGDAGIEENGFAREVLEGLRLPVMIAFSEDADVLHPGQHALFTRIFADAPVWMNEKVPGTKHFLQEDKGPELAERINAFIRET